MDRVKNAVIPIAVLVGIVIWASFGIGTSIGVPLHAIMYLDERSSQYYSPPCVEALGLDERGLLRTTEAEIRRRWAAETNSSRPRRMWPAQDCANLSNDYDSGGGFSQDGRSLGGTLLEKVGLLGPLPSRWRPDGSWRW